MWINLTLSDSNGPTLNDHKIPTSPSNASNVINLSSTYLPPTHPQLLELGLSFCGTTPVDTIELTHDIHQFSRKVRIREWAWHNDGNQDSNSPSPRTLGPVGSKGLWTPPSGRNPFIDNVINSVNADLNTFLASLNDDASRDNLSREDRKALKDLKNNPAITIKPVDKGGVVVVLDSTKYKMEADEQLSNDEFYQLLDSDPTPSYHKEPISLVNTFHSPTKEEVERLIPTSPNPGNFYTRPKIHKLRALVSNRRPDAGENLKDEGIINFVRANNILTPGRPIVSGICTLKEHISAYVDQHL
ncbi:hypothetical protein HOLleu_26452 [Holothuria leucospilota]|uniref:Uncharacterized protein n=1 Tax=Holothuria leucospilota TaxID=206669 RepID=A0A9Q1H2H5_HOLLE|nr:hypothetical protein HOLleu_26452 [Holothuria leucospilota]